MDEKWIMKTIAEGAARLGIRHIKSDPNRGIRYMVDLGAHFSRSPVPQEFYRNARRLLEKPGSAYRRLVSDVVARVDAKTLETMGVNLGYMSWAYGSALIRRHETRLGYHIPWALFLDCDYPAPPGVELNRLVSEGREIGIYTYMVFAGGQTQDCAGLLKLSEAFPDCAFILFSGSCEVSGMLARSRQPMRNVMVSLEYSQPDRAENARLLGEKQRLAATHCIYSDGSADSVLSGEALRRCAAEGCSFVFFIADSGCGAETARRVRDYVADCREKQGYPLFLMDLYSDVDYVDRAISSQAGCTRVRCDGAVFTGTGLAQGVNALTSPLERVLYMAAPLSRVSGLPGV